MNTKLVIKKTTSQNIRLNEYFVLIGQIWNTSPKMLYDCKSWSHFQFSEKFVLYDILLYYLLLIVCFIGVVPVMRNVIGCIVSSYW